MRKLISALLCAALLAGIVAGCAKREVRLGARPYGFLTLQEGWTSEEIHGNGSTHLCFSSPDETGYIYIEQFTDVRLPSAEDALLTLGQSLSAQGADGIETKTLTIDGQTAYGATGALNAEGVYLGEWMLPGLQTSAVYIQARGVGQTVFTAMQRAVETTFSAFKSDADRPDDAPKRVGAAGYGTLELPGSWRAEEDSAAGTLHFLCEGYDAVTLSVTQMPDGETNAQGWEDTLRADFEQRGFTLTQSEEASANGQACRVFVAGGVATGMQHHVWLFGGLPTPLTIELAGYDTALLAQYEAYVLETYTPS